MPGFERVAVLENEVQAQRVAAALADRDIPHVLKSYHDSALDGIFQNQRGWGHVETSAEHRQAVLDIVRDLAT